MQTKVTLQLFIEHEKEGTYFTLPFTVPPGTAAMSLFYRYSRHLEGEVPA